MSTNSINNHSVATFYYALSRMLERLAFYGLRALIVIYIADEFSSVESDEVVKVFGWFTMSLLLAKPIGATIGGVLLGSKKAIILGSIIQSIGAFSFCIPSMIGVYLGLFLVVIGNGLLTPNIMASFGRFYLNRVKLLDSGFTILYLAVNIGALFGAIIIGYLSLEYGGNVGFVVSGVIVLLSLVPFLKIKNQETTLENVKHNHSENKIVKIIVVFCLVSLFWLGFDFGNIRILELQPSFSELLKFEIPKSFFSSIGLLFHLIISVVAIILWSIYYSNQFVKLAMGFVFSVISFGILLIIPEIPSENYLLYYFLSLLFLKVSEVYIAPIVHTTLTKYTNPKYLAILISLAFLPTRLFFIIINLSKYDFSADSIFSLKLALLVLGIVSVGLIIYLMYNSKRENFNKEFIQN